MPLFSASLFSRVIRNLDFDDGGQAHHECGACRFDGDSWDPGPSRRGDVARALFYMDLRYDGSDGGIPDLELIDRTTAIDERHLGHLCKLVVWHGEDLVDDAERRRNDVTPSAEQPLCSGSQATPLPNRMLAG